MSDAATPAVAAPAAPAPAPAPAATPAQSATQVAPPVETVVLSKEEHAELARQAARGRAAQKNLDKLKSQGHFSPESQAPRPAPTQEQLAERAAEEDRKAERGLVGIAVDPAYREVLDSDPTLRTMFVQNPLSVLGVLAPDALDAEDALNLVKEKLEERKAKLKPAAPAAAPAPAPAAPPAGGVAVADAPPNAEYEAAKKNPNIEGAVAGMLAAKIKAAGKK